MTILTDPDRHGIASIKGARLTARPRPSNFACKPAEGAAGGPARVCGRERDLRDILFFRARAARGPRRKGLPLRSYAARNMPVTGVVVPLFIIFHLLDLTIGTRPNHEVRELNHDTVWRLPIRYLFRRP